MKKTLLLPIVLLMLHSCKKESQNLVADHSIQRQLLTEKVKSILTTQMNPADLTQLDFSSMVLTEITKENIQFLRIPFSGKNISGDFVLLKTDLTGKYKNGSIVHLDKKEGRSVDLRANRHFYEGNISISSLNRKNVVKSEVFHGYILKFHKEMQTRANQNSNGLAADVAIAPVPELPEIVIIGYRNPTGGISYSDWYMLQSMFGVDGSNFTFGGSSGSGSSGSTVAYYSPSDPGGGGSYGGDLGTGGTAPAVLFDYELGPEKNSIDVEKFMKCFATIPDAGSSFSMTLMSDIPVDSDPNAFFDWDNMSPGHAFLQFKKINGATTITQNIGFYPNQGWKTIFSTDRIGGKFVDNGQHEYNASLTMNVSGDDFRLATDYLTYLSKFSMYDLDDYNCTDLALEVFNVARPYNPLDIERKMVPGGITPYGTNTPQGIYEKLKKMKSNSDPEAANIQLPSQKAYADKSKGACN